MVLKKKRNCDVEYEKSGFVKLWTQGMEHIINSLHESIIWAHEKLSISSKLLTS